MPPWRSPLHTPAASLATLARLLADRTFIEHVVDAPYISLADVRDDREKLFHRLGTCARVAYEVAEDAPFTGAFATSAPGIVRLSLATDPSLFSVGVALKLLRHGSAPSANLLAAPGLDPQASRDVFAHPAYSRVPPPSTPVGRLFFACLGSRHDPYGLDLKAAASLDAYGRAVPRPVAPSRMELRPQVRLPATPADDFRHLATTLGAGTVLWQVWGDGQPMGQVRLTSSFIASSFGDRRLHFSHA